MRPFVLGSVLAVSLLIGGGGAALANHDHDIITPGTTVHDVANGQTEKCITDPGGHQFHTHMHTGIPGMVAFESPNNPVSVMKTEAATC